MRSSLTHAKKIVVKIGSQVLLEEDGRPNYAHIAHLVKQIAKLHQSGKDVIFVSSGAIGAGVEALDLKTRPTDLPNLQAAAAVGQPRLMRVYEDMFAAYGCKVAQLLLTHDDLKDRVRHVNAKHTLRALLHRRVIPIINENDTVSVDEIKFGDNDVLASLVALLIEANLLVLLTSVEGFLVENARGEKECLPHIESVTDELFGHVHQSTSTMSRGGMKSKLSSAHNMAHVGGVSVIASGFAPNVLEQILAGKPVGTLVGKINPKADGAMSGKKRWIAFYHKPTGSVSVDEGAKLAIVAQGKSLLPIGIKEVSGNFKLGSVIHIKDAQGNPFAKGISHYSSDDLRQIMGKDSKFIQSLFGANSYDEVIHRDNLVVLEKTL